MYRSLRLLPFLAALTLVSACDSLHTEASYPTRPEGSDKILYSDQKRETIWGDDGLSGKLFGKGDDQAEKGGIGVNSFLWRASLDTISFMPVASADPFGGVILTDWYENVKKPGERYKLNIYILDKALRADGLRVAAFKQKKDGKGWRDVAVPDDTAVKVENAILVRARELRTAQLGLKK